MQPREGGCSLISLLWPGELWPQITPCHCHQFHLKIDMVSNVIGGLKRKQHIVIVPPIHNEFAIEAGKVGWQPFSCLQTRHKLTVKQILKKCKWGE